MLKTKSGLWQKEAQRQMNDTEDKVQIHKLYLELYPELISSTNKVKQLNNYGVWSVLKTIDKHKEGAGKFKYKSILYVICQTLKVNEKYAYEVFKKGVNLFWKSPNKSKEVYLLSLDKVVANFPYEIAKTAPFKIRVIDLWKHDTPGELKTFLLGFLIGRYGQKKPLSKAALCDNLGCSLSTIKRQVKKSESITIKNNFEKIGEFNHINLAYEFQTKIKLMNPDSRDSYKIINDSGNYLVVKQLSNSYSVEDYSRIKISKRPRALKVTDSEVSESFSKRKYYLGKIKTNKDGVLVKISEGNEKFHMWNSISKTEELPEVTIEPQYKTRTRYNAKFWLNKEMRQE